MMTVLARHRTLLPPAVLELRIVDMARQARLHSLIRAGTDFVCLGRKDNSRALPRGPAADRRRDYPREREPRSDYYRGRDRDRDDYRRRPSRSPPRRGRAGYRDRDREGYRSPDYDSRSRSYSRSRSPRRNRPHYGHESKEVIMEGLPVDMVEEDISNELTEQYHIEGLEEVRVIRDRQTKISRQLGFLRFYSVDDSRAFLERNFPAIYLYGPNPDADGRGTRVRIAYSREREDRNRGRAEGDWLCNMCAIVNYATRQRCFRCQAPRPEFPAVAVPDAPPEPVPNTGDNDTAPENQPSQFLLFRGLETSVTEELFAKGVAKLYKPPSTTSQGASSSQKKGAKIASTTGDSNLGAREGSIRRVLLVRDRKTNESWRYGFAEFATVEDAQAALTRYNSFEKFTIASKPILVSYIHAGVFVPVLNPTPSTDRFTFSPLSNPSMKLAYWDEEGYVTELTVSTAELDTGRGKSKNDRSTDGHSKATKDAEKAKKRKAETAASTGAKKLAVPSHLQFWSNRHAELHGIQKKDGEEKSTGEALSNPASEVGSPGEASAHPAQSYADLNRNCCYLCMRQFKNSAEVNRHERLSQLHRDNLQDEELKTKAMGKLMKHGIQQPTPEYRDRAKERRQAFGRSKQPSKAKAPQPKEEEEAPAPAPSKGAALLSKMGWSAGSGLGAQGTGVTAPIATEVYAQGVGLGAQGSKLGDAAEEANRKTRNKYDEFLERTKETARERYERLG
ncbi:hypothetical protein DTO217A2_148 [Paecilomyces variotii]|nr:hypothetical protein DTO217A2_148 [Paecilomyces variotii]